MDRRRQSPPARLAAVAALAVAALVLIIVVSASLSGGGDDRQGGRSEPERRVRLNKEGKPQKLYIVKPGDSLSTIAEEVNVSVEKLQQLNPDIDPQALRSGARVRIR
jgi:LysM repeat protein